jgi:hypothetical protein
VLKNKSKFNNWLEANTILNYVCRIKKVKHIPMGPSGLNRKRISKARIKYGAKVVAVDINMPEL